MSVEGAYADYKAGRFEAAETKLAAELMRNAENGPALHLGAMVAQKTGRAHLALQRIQAALKDNRNLHEKFNLQGNILQSLHADVDAQRSYEAALQAKSGYDVARLNYAVCLMHTGQPDVALKQFEIYLRNHLDELVAQRGHILALIEANYPQRALQVIHDSHLPSDEKAALSAKAHFALNAFDEVIGQNIHVYSDPKLGADALGLSLQTLAMTGAWDEVGSALIDEIATTYPDNDALFAVALNALQKRGENERARALFDSSPKGPATLAKRAEYHVGRAEYQAADTLAREALGQQNGFDPAMVQLCYACLGLGDYDLAQQVSDTALSQNPHNQFYYAIKATAGRAKGQDYRYYFNYDRFVKAYDIPAPQGWDGVEAFNAALKSELEALHTFSDEPLDQTLRHGTQTSPNLCHVRTPAILAYFDAVRPMIADYIATIGHDPRHAFLRRNIGGFRIRSGWSIRLTGGGHHVNHIHPEGWISSAYYVEVPKGQKKAGWIKFGEPPAPLNNTLGQGPEHEIEPKAGRLVLFPSYLWHGTYPIAEGQSRMTLPIDILPAPPES